MVSKKVMMENIDMLIKNNGKFPLSVEIKSNNQSKYDNDIVLVFDDCEVEVNNVFYRQNAEYVKKSILNHFYKKFNKILLK